MNKARSSHPIWISIFAILLCPGVVVLATFLLEDLRPDLYRVEWSDIFGELLLLVLVQFWIVSVAYAQLRSVTYNYLIIGFAIITLANTADLLDEIFLDSLQFLNLLENIAYPLGMTISTIGLFKLSRDYRTLIQAVNQERDSWRRKANHDQLTGLFNRRYFFECAPEMLVAADAEKSYLSLMMLDIDHFKSVNDQHGHDVGDELLRLLGDELNRFCRYQDKAFRLGGEEFSILLHQAPSNAVYAAAERLRETINLLYLEPSEGERISRSVSIGVSTHSPNESLQDWVKRTDLALYEAKSSGRNCVRVAADNVRAA